MANQIIIDIGAVANDGTGDPLRTAFGYVNNNFSNVWASGVTTSNIAFDGNRILTTNVNGNLVLAPNGIGKVQSNVDIVPSANNALSLGSLTRQWNTVYAQNLEVAGDTTFNNLTVNGNLTVDGDIIQIGNLVTDAKTIQLANTASTTTAANGSGITVGANDNIATMLYSSTSNVWAMNIGANITGNVTAPYFIGNGSQLTGITSYANANVVAYGQAGWAGNIIPAGNAVYSLGNATNQWNDLYVSNATIFMNNVPLSLTAGNVLTVNGNAVLQNNSNTTISTTGNITGGYIFGNGSQLTGLSTSRISNGLSNVAIATANGNVTVTANGTYTWSFEDTGTLIFPASPNGQIYGGLDNDFIITTANANAATYYFTFSQFGDLSVPINLNVSGNVYAADIIGPGNGNVTITANTQSWLFDDTGVVTLPSAGQIRSVGNTGMRLSAGASDATGLLLDNTSDAEIYANANVSVYTDAGNIGWIFGADSTTTLPNYTLLNPVDEDFTILVQDADDDGFALKLEVDDGAGNTLAQAQLTRDDFGITTDFAGAGHNWTFDNTGRLNLPGNIAFTPTGGNASFYAVDDGNTGSVELKTISYAGDLLGSNIRVTQSNATISTANAAHTWTFDNTGNLTLPGNTFAVNYANGTAVTLGGNYGNANVATFLAAYGSNTISTSGNVTVGNLITSGNISTDWLDVGNIGNIAVLAADVKLQITADAGNTAPYWTFNNDGTLYVPGNISGDNSAPLIVEGSGSGEGYISLPSASFGGEQVAIVNKFSLGNGIRLETNGGNLFFDNTGDLTASGNVTAENFIGNISITGNVTGTSPNVTLVAGAYSTVFDNTGNLTVPGNIIMPPGTALRGSGASPAPSITGFTSVSAETLSATGNISGGNLSLSGNITSNIGFTGATITIDNAPGGNEGAEIKWALPSPANTVLSTSLVQDVFQNGMRFFEAGGNTRGLYMDLGNVPNGSTTAVGYRDIPQVSFTGNTTIATTDAGRHYYSTQSSNYILTIANNASQGFQVGAAITVVNQGTGNITVAQGSGVTLYLAGNATSGNRTVSTFGMATIIKVATDTWFINGTGVS